MSQKSDLPQESTASIELLQRRRFMATASGLAVATAVGAALPLEALQAQSGQGYKTLATPMATTDESRVEVLEFFWFGCPHCYAFEPAINAWKDDKPEYVNFVREAPPLNPSWEQHSRAFYAGEALGITDGFFDQMFNRIHQDRQPMRDPKKIAKFIETLDLGVSADKFVKAMGSYTVQTALGRSMKKARQAGVSGVPSILINGKYLTGGSLAGSHENIIRVINELSEAEHKAVG